ncbi:MAG: hypothetical protein M5U28_27755 [Sandaracinaceae bacterium]|nr:hypothetical protein [Sandaracinaceae bacterium]
MSRHTTSSVGGGSDRWRVAVLGVNAWVVVLLAPAVHVGLDLAHLALALLPAAPLAYGVACLGRRVERARWALLLGVPAGMGGVLALDRRLTEHEAYGTAGLVLATLSLLAFVAAAASAAGREQVTTPATSQPLVGKEPVVEPASRRVLRRALLAVSALGALAITVLAPALSARRDRAAAWGEAADDALGLTAVVAAVVAAIALGTLVGPSLRAERPRAGEPARSRRRLAGAMLIATAAGVGWLVLRHFDALP